MRRVKKQFNYSMVTIINAITGDVISEEKVTGKVNEEKLAISFIKQNGLLPIQIKVEDITEIRVMSGEDFIKYSTVLDDFDNDEDEEEDEEETEV